MALLFCYLHPYLCCRAQTRSILFCQVHLSICSAGNSVPPRSVLHSSYLQYYHCSSRKNDTAGLHLPFPLQVMSAGKMTLSHNFVSLRTHFWMNSGIIILRLLDTLFHRRLPIKINQKRRKNSSLFLIHLNWDTSQACFVGYFHELLLSLKTTIIGLSSVLAFKFITV